MDTLKGDVRMLNIFNNRLGARACAPRQGAPSAVSSRYCFQANDAVTSLHSQRCAAFVFGLSSLHMARSSGKRVLMMTCGVSRRPADSVAWSRLMWPVAA
jgi:hypothetical protein